MESTDPFTGLAADRERPGISLASLSRGAEFQAWNKLQDQAHRE